MITVNLFDNTFRQAVCSVAYKTPKHIRYVRGAIKHDGITLFVDGCATNGSAKSVESRYKIAWLHEPECLHPNVYRDIIHHENEFDFILTHYQPLLDRSPKYGFCPYGGVWIDKEHWRIGPKQELVSMLFGEKKATAGHLLRHAIYDRFQNFKKIDWYGCRGRLTDYSQETKEIVLSPYMFTIVTETCCADNLFTEILLDCFSQGTIPIFWGAPNIGAFFNADGILHFDNLDDLGQILMDITPKLYGMMWDAAVENLGLIHEYEITEDWMFENILKGVYA